MASSFEWIEEYYKWMKDTALVCPLQNGWTGIATTFMDRHNDVLTVYAKLEGDSITLSDAGYIINDLLADGVSLNQKKPCELLDSILLLYGVQNVNNEMIMHTTVSKYPISMHMFIQAMLTVNDMFMLSDSQVKTS